MKRLLANKKELLIIAKAKPSLAKRMLATSSDDIIKALTELVLNILSGKIRLTPSKKLRFKPYKTKMRKLADPSSVGEKRSQLQVGGFLGALLSVGLPLAFKGLSALVGAIRRKKAQRKTQGKRRS